MAQLRRRHTPDHLEGGSDGQLIQHVPEACRSCWGCVRYCPARAIRVVDGHSEIIAEKCVRCGLCVTECGNCGHVVRDDTHLVRDLLGSGRPVVAVLATEFVAALHPISAAEVEGTLEALGFYAVESTLLGEELVATAYEARHTSGSGFPLLRSTCPVVTEWVMRFHPALAPALIPVVPPYVAQARLVKALYPDDTAVVYMSPCYARKDEWRDPELADAVDAVIDFTELAAMLQGAQATPGVGSGTEVGGRRPEPLKELSLTDGYPRSTLVTRNMTASDVQVVRGLKELDRLLNAIEGGEAAPLIVDTLNCEGCIDGPAVNPGMSLFAKRNVDAAEREARVRSTVSSRELLKHLPRIEVVRAFVPRPVCMPSPPDSAIDAILAEGGFDSRASTIDCGSCGYPTCVEHAVAIFQGNSTWDMCFPLQRERLADSMRSLEESATLDSLTGLWNRRVFSERLSDEIARNARYGTPISLLMIDLDGFKDINDRYGHVTGDAVLKAVSEVLRASLRATDLPARYGGDEFAVLLPGVHKTDAFAVAEKLRLGIEALDVKAAKKRGDGTVVVRASIGVAAANRDMSEPVHLVEAADHALYQAKDGGRDQVRLAPG
jgi:diguanylate cyclase (GGDEF)-like protein